MNGVSMSRADLIEAIRLAFIACDGLPLTYERFRAAAPISMSTIYKHFDSWRHACEQAQVECGRNSPENIKPNYSRGREHAIEQLRKAAICLNTKTLSKSQFNAQNPEVCASTVARLFGSWEEALNAAGLQRNENFRDHISIKDLSLDLLCTFRELGHVPTVRQVVRRSAYGLNSFTRKFGGYSQFKVAAIKHLLGTKDVLLDSELGLLQHHLDELNPGTVELPEEPAPHHRGRHLGFRAFAFAPTYESEVVSLFSVIAEELGFEIVAQRPAFPDCEVRRLIDRARKRYNKCLIEFELRSSDFVRHKHPVQSDVLIVCWDHDWPECLLEVIELRSVIKRLPGWK